jgi:hypothetical protein
VLQVSTTVLVGSARYSLWQQVKVLVEGVPVVLQVLCLTQSALDLSARFIHCFNPAEPPLEAGDKLSQSSHLLCLTSHRINRWYRESPATRSVCDDLTSPLSAIKHVVGDGVFDGGPRHVITVRTDGVRMLRDVPGLHPGWGSEPLEDLLTKVTRIAKGGVTLDESQLSCGLRHVVLTWRVWVAERSESELRSSRRVQQRLSSCEFEQLLDGGCNGVGVVEVRLRGLLTELERLL